jgi:hypothetical protein
MGRLNRLKRLRAESERARALAPVRNVCCPCVEGAAKLAADCVRCQCGTGVKTGKVANGVNGSSGDTDGGAQSRNRTNGTAKGASSS